MNRIVNYTIPCPPYPLTEFLRLGAGMERFYFESGQSSVAIAALGIGAQISHHGENRFSNLGASLQDFFQRIIPINESDALPRPILLGGGAFFDHVKRGIWDSFPSAALTLPRYALIRAGGEYFFSINHTLTENETPALAAGYLRIEAKNFIEQMETAILPPPSFPDELITNTETSRAEWENSIRHSIGMIRAGMLKKVVIARPLQVHGNRPLDVPVLLERLGASCPACFRFLFEFMPGRNFAGVTPERLISVSGTEYNTVAIAGSIRRGGSPVEDDALGRQLLHSAKDQSEHAFVLDHIREKMSPLVKTLDMDSAPKLLRLPNIQHLCTDITGTLKAGHNILNIVAALHPTPAVGGMPGEAALRLIRELEGFERGWYAAPVGWVDADGNGDFVVAIRSGLFQGSTATLFGGAGIVADSDPQKEWDETGLKARFLLDAMQGEMV